MFLFCFVDCSVCSSICVYPSGVTKVGPDVPSRGLFYVVVCLLLFPGFVYVFGGLLDCCV